jgi:hypothetical protein
VRAMKWAKDFRMDAPWSQMGENTSNPWSDTGKFRVGGVAVMVDNFAIPAATIRGLFDCDYRSDRLILRPRIPGSITHYTQKVPILFGEKKLLLSCSNGGPNVKSVKINGKEIKSKSSDEVILLYNDLPAEAKIEIITEGGWPKETTTTTYPTVPELIPGKDIKAIVTSELPESLKKPYSVLSSMNKLLVNEPDAEEERAFIVAAIKSCEDYLTRVSMEPGPGYYRPITNERKDGINKFYEQVALSMYNGFANRMTGFAEKGDTQQKHLADLFRKAQNN